MPHVTEEIWSHLPAASARLIVSPWPEPDDRFADDVGALDRVQEAARSSGAAACGRARSTTSGASSPPSSGRSAPRTTATRRPRSSGSRKEIARAEGMLANERFVANAPRRGRRGASARSSTRYRRELDAARVELTAPIGSMTAVEWLDALEPVAGDGFGLERMRALLAALGDPQGALPGDPRRRHERQVDGDA